MNIFFLCWKLIYTCKTWVYNLFGEIRTKKSCISLFVCAACLSASLIMYDAPISELHANAMTLMFTFQHVFELSTLPSIPYNNSCFIIIRQNFFLASFSSRISKNSRNAACRFSFGRKYMSYNFWVAPLEFSSHKGMKLSFLQNLVYTIKSFI